MKHLLVAIVATLFYLPACAAGSSDTSGIITGRVVSEETASPLEGAMVLVKGTSLETGTMPNGIFSLPVSSRDTVLLVSLDGYEKKEVRVAWNSFCEIVLRRANNPNTFFGSFIGRKSLEKDR